LIPPAEPPRSAITGAATMQTLFEMLAGAIGALFLWAFFFVLFLF
jgi:hypothetical protein